jgi:hypothetical protein
VNILKGGRTGLLIFENSGALNQNRQLSTVDLRSNGRWRARTVDPAVGAVHGSTVDHPT